MVNKFIKTKRVKKTKKTKRTKRTKKVVKVKRKTQTRKVQKGGVPQGGTSFTDLPANLLGLVEYTTDSIVAFTEGTWYALNIGSDMGAAFGPGEPNPDSVTVPSAPFS